MTQLGSYSLGSYSVLPVIPKVLDVSGLHACQIVLSERALQLLNNIQMHLVYFMKLRFTELFLNSLLIGLLTFLFEILSHLRSEYFLTSGEPCKPTNMGICS